MKLSILLEATYAWNGNKATFKVGEDEIIVRFQKKSFYETCEFYRAQDEEMPWAFKATGTSANPTAVLKTVEKIMRERLEKKTLDALAFTADEPKRLELYKKLALRTIKGLNYKIYLHKKVHLVMVKDGFELPHWFQAEELKL